MRRSVIAVAAGAVVLAGCAAGPSGGSPTGTLDAGASERVAAACAGIVRELQSEVGDGDRVVSALEDIHAAVGDDLPDLRTRAEAAGAALDEDLATSPGARYEAATELVPLAEGLVAAGADGCADLASVAGVIVASEGPGPAAEAPELLADARDRWSDRAIDDYTIEVVIGPVEVFEGANLCGGDLMIVVVDGRPSSIVDRFGGCRIEPDEAGDAPVTVEDLFALVERHLDAVDLDVDYDPEFGVPRSVFARGPDGVVELSVVSFAPGAGPATADAILAELAARRADWAAAGIDMYEMVVQVDCFCPEEYRGPFDVTVVDGAVVTATWKGEPIPDVAERRFFTVEDLFETIEGHAYADEIDVEYAPEGYPTRIAVDPSRMTMDEELGIRILEFHATR